MLRLTILTVAALALGKPALSETVALAIGNESYRNADPLEGSRDVVRAAEELGGDGVEVISRVDATGPQMLEAFTRFARRAPEADAALVVLSGEFAHSDRETWLVPSGMASPRIDRLVERGLPVSALVTVLAAVDGPAILLVATRDRPAETGPLVEPGPGDLPSRDGVLAISTSPATAERIVREVLAGRRGSLEDALRRLEADRERAIADAGELTAWAEARQADTEAAYRDYLERYPEGENALSAQLRLYQLERDPARQAERQEAALSLTREERQRIQRNLSILGYQTRGVDGIFGPGTRSAIEAWQEANAYDVTGFVSAPQADVLARQAEARLREQETEAARRAEEDRAWWEQTGATGTADGYRRYLERYPDGRFADTAEARLDEFEDDEPDIRDALIAERDRRAWDTVRQDDTVESYRRYLDAYPEGAFVRDARRRIRALRDGAAADQAALQTEQQLQLAPVVLRLVEQRLAEMNLSPGAVDGELDADTRGAIRRFQAERDLSPTGYLDQPTLARLLSDSLQQLLE